MRLLLAAAFVSIATLAVAQTAPKPIPAPADVAKPPADAAKTKSGLASIVLKPGSGAAHPKSDDLVTVNYTAWTTDGKMFDASPVGRPATFPLDRVISGLNEGVQLMVAGEKRRLWIPESLAKGQRSPKGTLVFDVELVSFTDSPATPPPDLKTPPAEATKTASGLAYKVLTPGTGTRHPQATSTVKVQYSGWNAEGKLFDSSVLRGEPQTLQLNGVIAGWTEMLQLMVEGEKVRLWVPEDLAYKGRGPVAGNLVFDIELVQIQ